jgi:exosome complex RNA-binding protein Rrp42 (RNase PH superfamily)
MNFDILQKSIPEESLNAFLEKEIRYDNRKFYESRKFNFSSKVLNSFKYSAIGSLGLNKILLVLKETGKKNNEEKPVINIIIDNFENAKKNKQIFDFIEKLIKNRLMYDDIGLNERDEYDLFVTIENSDGNIFEVIAKSLEKFFSKENDIGIIFNEKFISKTICFINGNILFDPLKQEVEMADFICNIIKFKDKFIIYKLGGLCVDIKLIKEAILQIENS